MSELEATGRPGQVAAATCDTIAAFTQRAPASGELTTEVITDVTGLTGLRSEYEHLHLVSGNTVPFALLEWHLSWCTHFLNRSPRVSDQPLFCVARNDAGECVAIMPFILTRRQLGPLRVTTVSLIGGDPALTEIRSPLIKLGYERLTVRAVYRCLASVPDWDWIHWSGVSTPLATAVAHEITPQWYGITEDCILDLPASWDDLRAGMKRNLRESLRHCYNSLRRDGHSFELVVARERAEIRQALGRFLELHALRAGMPSGSEHVNHFAGRSVRDFLYDVCDRLVARDCVRVFQLRIGGSVVAARIGFVVGNSLYLYYSGFDPAWARYSVMTTTMAEAIKYAIAAGLSSVNLSLTADRAKLRWRPRLVEYHSALVHRDPLSSRLMCGAYRLAVSSNTGPARLLKSLLGPRREWS